MSSIWALRSGKHVYSENRWAELLKEAPDIIALAKEKNLYGCCAPDGYSWSGGTDPQESH